MLDLSVVVLYLLALVTVGIVKARRVRGQAGFSLAGRSLGVPVLVGTLLATWTGTGSIFGTAEEAYKVGLPVLVAPLGTAVGLAVLALLCTRVRARRRYTLQDILEERFGVAARVLGTITLVTAYLVIVSYQLRAGAAVTGRLLEVNGVTAISNNTALVLVAVFIAGYTALSGMMGVAVTDTFNGLLMTTGLLLALPLVWAAGGGIQGVFSALPESASRLGGHYTGFDILSITLPTFLLVIGDANLHQRFLSARSDAAARTAALLFIPAVLVLDAIIIVVATGGSTLLPGLAEPGHVVLELALSDTILPSLLGAMLVAAILAVIVSTADSYLLAASTSLVHDVFQRFIRPDASERLLLLAARIGVVLLASVAVMLAFAGQEFFRVALFAYTIYGVGITPALLAALFWKRATPIGATTSMLAAVTTAIAWRNGTVSWDGVEMEISKAAARWVGAPEGAAIDAVMPAVFVAGVLLIGVSLVTRPRAAEPAR